MAGNLDYPHYNYSQTAGEVPSIKLINSPFLPLCFMEWQNENMSVNNRSSECVHVCLRNRERGGGESKLIYIQSCGEDFTC